VGVWEITLYLESANGNKNDAVISPEDAATRQLVDWMTEAYDTAINTDPNIRQNLPLLMDIFAEAVKTDPNKLLLNGYDGIYTVDDLPGNLFEQVMSKAHWNGDKIGDNADLGEVQLPQKARDEFEKWANTPVGKEQLYLLNKKVDKVFFYDTSGPLFIRGKKQWGPLGEERRLYDNNSGSTIVEAHIVFEPDALLAKMDANGTTFDDNHSFTKTFDGAAVLTHETAHALQKIYVEEGIFSFDYNKRAFAE
tara:strand:- start:39 stop:791 length:753 start_codon:yes stop_codon:yes gene_type:complete